MILEAPGTVLARYNVPSRFGIGFVHGRMRIDVQKLVLLERTDPVLPRSQNAIRVRPSLMSLTR